MSENNDNKQHRLTSAYDRMLDNVRSAWQQASKETRPKLDVLIATAREKISELEELTVEEAEKIGEYLKRDLQPFGLVIAIQQRAQGRYQTQVVQLGGSQVVDQGVKPARHLAT